MKFDLHSHSYFSDGKHSPEFVLERARDNDVTHLALTDHDCVEGILALRARGEYLITLLKSQQEKRQERINAISNSLEKAGINGLDDYMSEQKCISPSRSHVAEFLMREGKSGSRKKAFKSLIKNGRFYSKPHWCSVAEAIDSIKTAGGLAILAHPHRYKLTNTKLKRLVSDFKISNGDGLEVCYSNMGNDEIEFLAGLSEKFELSASVGSDFHDANATWMNIGKVPPLPESCKKNAIWLHPRWHF
jgi:predicted metal-dependent phosphoesterase TrpH